jgi:hypothetical protein
MMLSRIKPAMADLAANLLALLLKVGGPNTYRDAVNALWERQPIFAAWNIELYLPEHVAPDPAELPIVNRIFRAYQRAKHDQARQPSYFLPSGGWKKVLESGYAPLIKALERNDVTPLHYFLANFGVWQQQTGIEESWSFHRVAASGRKQAHYEQGVVGQLIHWWKTFESDGRSVSALAMPRFGNQAGALVDGQLITPSSVYSDFYARLLAGFVGSPHPVIAELGGGYGRLLYFLSRHFPAFKYVDIDLPEILCCASYYLMMSFPEKRVLLYGEADVTAESLAEYDLIFLPSFEINKLPDRSVDLFVNENSLGVIPPAAARYFVTEMCRTAEAIWHRNHEVRRNRFDDGSLSLLNREYPFDPEHFEQFIRYCDIERLTRQTLSADKNDMYWYYLRRTT